MELSLNNSAGMFSGVPVEREITWTSAGQSHTATVFVRQLSYHAAVSDIKSHVNGSDALAGRIAACIVDKNNKPIFTAQDITGEANIERGALDGNLTLALLSVISEVNSLGESKS